MLKTLLAGVGLTSIALVAAVGIHAGYYDDDSAPRSLAVNYAAFDLTTPQGVALLEHRIDQAVERVCGVRLTDNDRYNRDDQDCVHDAWAGAEPQMERAIARARYRGGRDGWGPPAPAWSDARPWHSDMTPRDDEPRRFVPPPRTRRGDDGAWEPRMQERRDFAPPPPRPAHIGGVLGGPIDPRISLAFETGSNVKWRDHGWHGLVQVSAAREIGHSICRTVSIVRPVGAAWQLLREGAVCLRPDGALHNGV